ncbi:N-acetylmuramoyl-L-alanine amidase [Streptomyces sp. JH14]|uniref:N-acetylmuramoyl-L-alanine amidase n=1 Tax=Streptomyces sp. JH14 TaxID=2793630 RepID=UPI0023F7B780|nr:N-acetylmuramoyl-L-alanine amidase [Streptomyces sp. JH14]MDF6041978.1 N-acetylmuramoyl-L-alanine amidase [Streptomyces sp. JH14]
MYGVGTAVLVTATVGTIAMASQDAVTTDSKPASPTAVLQGQFEDAAREFDVPQSVLMAVSYRQTRWESHDGEPSTSGAYNVMGLTRVTEDDVEKPTKAEQLAHLNMSGDPAVMKHFDAARALKGMPDSVDTSAPELHTLDEAAKLIDKPVDAVQDDTAQSIRAGAALLAQYQREATDSLPDDAGQWYPAVARYSQSPDTKGATLFANRVFASVKSGESRLTADGQQLSLPADPSVTPVKPSKMPLAATNIATTATPAPECPTGLNCDFKPAGYKQNSTTPDDFGNYNVANRPASGEDIRSIVIHDTEGGYAGSLATFQNPASYASAHYMIRANDGLVTQMVETKNEAWHAANKTANMHSIGIEHEGYAIKSGSWYTEPQYESSATLVKYLANRFGIPLDREHIIGHDEVPGVLDGNVASQHWDPGPFWDWNHYMTLIGAPTGAEGAGGPLKAGQVVRVVPPFTTANQPALTYGGAAVAKQPANFGYLYTSPSTTATKITDPYIPNVTSTDGPNWGNKVVAGGTYVVAEAQTNWTAIWYGGKKAWFQNPSGQFTAPVGKTAQPVLKPKAGATSIPVYGRAYPEDAAYAGTGVDIQAKNNESLSKYSIPAGQAYPQAGPAQVGDYWFAGTFAGTAAGDRTLVKGSTNLFYPIRYNHRMAWVKASDVQQASSTVPDAGTNRYNILGRDSAGVLWQYQGTGSATAPFYGRYRVGPGWQDYNSVTAMTALRADGTGDMVARDKSGTLWYYRGGSNPSKPFLSRLKVGGGWGVYNGLWGARDLDADGKADLIARDSSGVLWFYKGTGTPATPFATKARVGGGWSIYNSLVSTGDLTGDGKPDLVARDSAGVLWLYKGTGSATAPYAARTQVGKGWGVYNNLLGPSDLDRDGIGDLVARDTSGVLWFYKGTGSATAPFGARVKVGSGWSIYNQLV